MSTTHFPKTIAAIQKRDHSLWDIGDALLAECPIESDAHHFRQGKHGDGSRVRLEAVAKELDHLQIDGYTVNYLSILRDVSHKFRRANRDPKISWMAHRSSGSPEMLDAIIEATPKTKKITNVHVRGTRAAIEEHVHRRRVASGTKQPPSKKEISKEEMPSRNRISFLADLVSWARDLKGCDKSIVKINEKIADNIERLAEEDVDALVDIALTIAEHARELADTARKLRKSSEKRTHLSVVGE